MASWWKILRFVLGVAYAIPPLVAQAQDETDPMGELKQRFDERSYKINSKSEEFRTYTSIVVQEILNVAAPLIGYHTYSVSAGTDLQYDHAEETAQKMIPRGITIGSSGILSTAAGGLVFWGMARQDPIDFVIPLETSAERIRALQMFGTDDPSLVPKIRTEIAIILERRRLIFEKAVWQEFLDSLSGISQTFAAGEWDLRNAFTIERDGYGRILSVSILSIGDSPSQKIPWEDFLRDPENFVPKNVKDVLAESLEILSEQNAEITGLPTEFRTHEDSHVARTPESPRSRELTEPMKRNLNRRTIIEEVEFARAHNAFEAAPQVRGMMKMRASQRFQRPRRFGRAVGNAYRQRVPSKYRPLVGGIVGAAVSVGGFFGLNKLIGRFEDRFSVNPEKVADCLEEISPAHSTPWTGEGTIDFEYIKELVFAIYAEVQEGKASAEIKGIRSQFHCNDAIDARENCACFRETYPCSLGVVLDPCLVEKGYEHWVAQGRKPFTISEENREEIKTWLSTNEEHIPALLWNSHPQDESP